MRNYLLFLTPIFLLFFCGYLLPQDYEPVICTSVGSYKGPPIYEGLTDKVWDKLLYDMDGSLSSNQHIQMTAVVDEILHLTNSPAISAAVGIPGKGLWSISKGLALTDPETPLDSMAYFHWASIGKAFTATAVIQLIEKNKLSYSDPLSKWIPDFPNAGVITVDHLLLHTSGIFSFNSDVPFREETGYKEPDELLEIARRHGNIFCPGEYWSYSNTNYVLLALILEKIERKPFDKILTDQIIEPLGLKNTIALSPEQIPIGLVKGHTEEGPDDHFNESLPFGAGIIVSSARDMILFWHSLLGGKLITLDSVQNAFVKLYPMFDKGTYYGRGVMLYDIKNEKGERVVWWLGHSGGTEGLKAIIACDINTGIYVAVALNNSSSAEAAANRLVSEAKSIMK